MNHLSGVDRLANRFSIMRHGQSKANARGIIVSSIENDRRGDYGLSELGRQQALTAARGCGLPGNTVICSSDFSRARQTAEIVRAHLGAPEVVIAEALRERRFGDWEASATGNYAQVWAADETTPCSADGNVERSYTAVVDRDLGFIPAGQEGLAGGGSRRLNTLVTGGRRRGKAGAAAVIMPVCGKDKSGSRSCQRRA